MIGGKGKGAKKAAVATPAAAASGGGSSVIPPPPPPERQGESGTAGASSEESKFEKATAVAGKVAVAVEGTETALEYVVEKGTAMDLQTGAVEETEELSGVVVEAVTFVLGDGAKDVLAGVVDTVQDALPYAKAVIGVVKSIYERYNAIKAVKVELREFVNFIQTLETAVVAALKSSKIKAFLERLAVQLKEAGEIVACLTTKRNTKWSRFWNSKADRESLVEMRQRLRETMNDTQFTIAVETMSTVTALNDATVGGGGGGGGGGAAAAVEKADALRNQILAKVGHGADETAALQELFETGNEDLKTAVLERLGVQEGALKGELDELKMGQAEIKKGQAEIKTGVDKLLDTTVFMLVIVRLPVRTRSLLPSLMALSMMPTEDLLGCDLSIVSLASSLW